MIALAYVIVIAHRKGGTGKSTTACNLLAELSKKFPTTLIDADTQQHLSKFNAKRDKPVASVRVTNVKELREFLQNDKGLTIIDLGGYDSDFSRGVLAYADMVITPLNDSSFEQDGLMDFTRVLKQIVAKSGREDIKPFILTNRVHYNDKSTQKAYKKFAEGTKLYQVFDTIIADRKVYKGILASGKSVVEIEPKSKASLEMQSLVQEIINKG